MFNVDLKNNDYIRVLYTRVLGTSMGFLGGPTDRVGDAFNFFVRPLSKLCVSNAHLRVREKHALYVFIYSTVLQHLYSHFTIYLEVLQRPYIFKKEIITFFKFINCINYMYFLEKYVVSKLILVFCRENV